MSSRKNKLHKRIMGYLLCGAVFINVNMGYAESPKVVNIVAPNSEGISLNRTPSLDIPKEGVIFNNSLTGAETALAGFINGNSNFNARTANLIINEVTGTNKSNLLGALEIGGDRAALIIANKNGIIANGANFINASQVSLWAGTPIYDNSQNIKKVMGVQIEDGTIDIQEAGITAETSTLNLLGRSLKANGAVTAENINIVLGRGQITQDSKAEEVKVDNARAKLLDISALGGMYANSIYIETLEAGTAIHNEGTLKSKENLSLTANGDIILEGTVEGKKIKVATPYDVEINHDIQKDVLEIKEGTATSGEGGSGTGNLSGDGWEVKVKELGGGREALYVNIATPTIDGISYNRTPAIQVDANMPYILNNSFTGAETELAGWIEGNTNLYNRTASLIIGETTDYSQSYINGNLEIAGDRAAIILANPDGIALGGGRFINVEKVTFVTGNVGFDTNHKVTFNVAGGNIIVGNNGFDGKNINQLNFITNDAEINGKITTENINFLLGNGSVDYNTLQITAPNTQNQSERFLTIGDKGSIDTKSIAIYAKDDNIGLIQNGEINASQALRVNLTGNILMNGSTHGEVTEISTTKDMANNGLIDGSRVYLKASTLVNQGGIFGSNVSVASDSVANEGKVIISEPPKPKLTQQEIDDEIEELIVQIIIANGQGNNFEMGMLTSDQRVDLITNGYYYGDELEVSDDIKKKYQELLNYNLATGNNAVQEIQKDSGGIIYASQNLNIGSKNIYNRQGSVFYSDGDINIGGKLDENDEAIEMAQTLYNDGATIQSTGSTYVKANEIHNTNPNLKIQTEEGAWVNDPDRIEIDAPGSEYNHVIATKDYFARLGDKYDYDYIPYPDKRGKYEKFISEKVEMALFSPQELVDYCGGMVDEPIYDMWIESGESIIKVLDQLDMDYRTARDMTTIEVIDLITQGIQKKYGKTIDEYNAMVEEYNKQYKFANYWQIYSKHQDITSNVLASTPAKISAGNNLYLNGDVINKDSLLLAGERLQIDGSLENVATAVTDGTKYSGSIEHSHPHQYWHTYHNKTKRVWENNENYQEPDELVSYYIPTVTYYTLEGAGNSALALTDQEQLAYKDGAYWLSEEEKEVDGKQVKNLVVHVDGASQVKEETVSSLLSAKEIIINSTKDNYNQGTMLSNVLAVKAKSFANEGELRGKDITMNITDDINNSGNMIAENKLNLAATNINSTTAETLARRINQEDASEAGLIVTGDDGLLLLQADKNITIQNNHLANSGKNGKILLDAGGNINFDTATFTYKIGTTNSENNVRTITTDSGSIAEAEGDITLQAGQDINIKASAVRSAEGKVSLLAGQDINVSTGKNSVDTRYKYRYKNGGIGSKRGTTTSEEKSFEKDPIPSEIQGDSILFAANRDINLLSSNTIDRNNSLFKAGRDITSAVDTSFKTTEYTRTFSGSGISLGNGFLGIRIGKWTESHETNTSEENPLPTTITSTNGHVDLDAEGKVHATTTYIYGKDGVTIAGSSVILDGTEAKRTYKQVDAYSFKGLTVGLGGSAYSHLNNAYMFAGDAFKAKDKRLAVLQAIEAGKEIDKYQDILKTDAKDKYTLSLALTSQSDKQTYDSTVIRYEGGMVGSEGDVIIKSKDLENGSITLIGQTLSGKKIELETYNLNIESGENNSSSEETSEHTGGSAGVDIGGEGVTPNIGGNHSDSETKENQVSYTPTVLQGDSIEIVSGGNTNIKGSVIKGKNVKMDVGGNLDITSDQNSYTYNSKNASVGFNIGLKAGSAQATTGKTDYTLKTVVEQAGISAGEEGLDITVKGKTTLTGAVIDSSAAKEKNKITTGDLEMKNIENISSEKDGGFGIGYNEGKDVEANEKGLIPMLPIAGSEEQKSTTYAAIVDGKLVVTGNKDFKEEDVNRNTENTLNALANTLDLQKIAERKKLAELFAKNAFEQVHILTDEKHLDLPEGSTAKVVLHAVVAGITAKLGGDNFAAGSMAGAVNEIMNGVISRYAADGKKITPAEHQWISAAVGAIVNSATGQTIQTGMADAVYATKWNYLNENKYKDYDKSAKEADEKGDKDKAEYYELKKIRESEIADEMLNDTLASYAINFDDNSPKELQIIGLMTDGKNYKAVINIPETVINDISKKAAEKVDSTYGKTYEEYLDKKKNGFDKDNYDSKRGVGLSIATNTVAAKVDASIDILKDSLSKNGYKGIKIPSGIGGQILTTTVLYDDYQKYSGVNLYMAWGIDVGVNYGVGKLGGAAIGSGATILIANPLVGMGVYTGVGIASDISSDYLKKWLIVPDYKKNNLIDKNEEY